MALLAFLLQGAALAALVGTAAALSGLLALRAVAHRGPALRADVAAAAGVLPALAAGALLGAVALPSVAGLLGLAADHCPSHGHHAHLCLVHYSGLSPALAALGAATLAVFIFRAGALLRGSLTTRAHLTRLERLGECRAGAFPLILLPGAPQLCHAAGVRRPRILLSASLAQALEPEELRAALAHETAHLRRGDPLLRLLLSVAGLFAPPPLARRFLRAYQSAAEEACDGHAVGAGADGTVVAGALVKVASLQRTAALSGSAACAFGATALERRVGLLLAGPHAHVPARRLALGLIALLGLLASLAALARGSAIHHAVETALHHVF